MNTPKLTYALNQANELVHIDSVSNGSRCGCICPYCKKPLLAKHEGKIMQHHFAHANDEACNVSHESMLHQMAKEIILEQKSIMVPEYHPARYTDLHEQTPENADIYLWHEDFDDCESDEERDEFDPYWRLRFLPAQRLKFSEVIIEERDGVNGIQADCIGITNNGTRYLLEIYVTHKVDDAKLEKIKNGNLNCFEIKIPKTFIIDKSSLTNYLLNRKDGRKWLNYPYAEAFIPQRVEKAQRDAIIRQRTASGVKEIPIRLCDNCKVCLRQFDDIYYDFLNKYKGKLLDWAYEVFSMKPEDVVNDHITIRKNNKRESYVVINRKAHIIYSDEDKQKCKKTFAFFCNLYDECYEIISLGKNHRDCRYFISQLEYQTKQYVFCELNYKNKTI